MKNDLRTRRYNRFRFYSGIVVLVPFLGFVVAGTLLLAAAEKIWDWLE